MLQEKELNYVKKNSIILMIEILFSEHFLISTLFKEYKLKVNLKDKFQSKNLFKHIICLSSIFFSTVVDKYFVDCYF